MTHLSPVIFCHIIPIKIARLAEYVSERRRISLDEALTYIYSNDMYRELYNEGARWWYMSAEAAILQLKAYKTYDQLSFHTPREIKTLKFVESYINLQTSTI